MFATDLGSNARFRRQISQKPQISLVPDLAEGIPLPHEQGEIGRAHV